MKWNTSHSQQKYPKFSTWVKKKKKKALGSFPRQTIQIQDYVPTTNAKGAEINQFYEDI